MSNIAFPTAEQIAAAEVEAEKHREASKWRDLPLGCYCLHGTSQITTKRGRALIARLSDTDGNMYEAVWLPDRIVDALERHPNIGAQPADYENWPEQRPFIVHKGMKALSSGNSCFDFLVLKNTPTADGIDL